MKARYLPMVLLVHGAVVFATKALGQVGGPILEFIAGGHDTVQDIELRNKVIYMAMAALTYVFLRWQTSSPPGKAGK